MRGAVLAVAVLAAGAGAAHAELGFHAPPGWRVVTASDPAGASAELALAARAGAALVAFDPVTAGRGSATLVASVTPKPLLLVDDVTEAMAAQLQPATAYLVERRLFLLAGVRAARIVFDTGEHRRVVHYLFEAGPQGADLVFRCATADYDRELPVFEAAARATSGLAATAMGTPAPAGRFAHAGGFSFAIPEGWIDLSPAVSDAAVPEPLRQFRNPAMAALAIDPHGSYPASLAAQLLPGRRIDLSNLPALEEQLTARFPRVTVTERHVLAIAGLPAARFIASSASPREIVVAYFSAAGAVLVFGCTPEDLEADLPIFEATAAATRFAGASARSSARWLGRTGVRAALALGCLLLVLLAIQRARRPPPLPWLWMVMTAVGAVMVAWSTQRTWMAYDDSRGAGRVEVDLDGVTLCASNACDHVSYPDLPDDGHAHWRGVARLLDWVGLGSAALLVLAVVGALLDGLPLLGLVWPSLLASLAFVALALAFCAIALAQAAHLGWFDKITLALVLGGSALGMASRVGIGRQQRGGASRFS